MPWQLSRCGATKSCQTLQGPHPAGQDRQTLKASRPWASVTKILWSLAHVQPKIGRQLLLCHQFISLFWAREWQEPEKVVNVREESLAYQRDLLQVFAIVFRPDAKHVKNEYFVYAKHVKYAVRTYTQILQLSWASSRASTSTSVLGMGLGRIFWSEKCSKTRSQRQAASQIVCLKPK